MAKAKFTLTDAQIEQLGAEYRAGASTSELHRKYGPNRQTIENWAKKFGWTRDQLINEAIAAATSKKLRDANSPATAAANVDRIAGDRAGLILGHQGAWNGIDELYDDAMRVLAGKPTKRLMNPAPVYNDKGEIVEKAEVLTIKKRVDIAAKLIAMYEGASRALMTKQEGERRAWGFDYRTQQEGNAVNEAEIRRRNELIEKLREHGSKLAVLQDLQQATTTEKAAPRPPAQPQTIDGEVLT